jgi:type VI secretion system VasD/TssJ family lipoprotein
MNQGNAAVIRVYALRGPSAIAQASLEALWADDAAALRGDLVSREEVRLYPGESHRLAMEAPPEVTHVAVAANLRAAAEQEWVRVFRVDELWGEGARVIIGADRVSVAGE